MAEELKRTYHRLLKAFGERAGAGRGFEGFGPVWELTQVRGPGVGIATPVSLEPAIRKEDLQGIT